MLFNGSYLGSYELTQVLLSAKPLPGRKFLIHAKLLTEDGIEDVLMYKFGSQSEYSIIVDEIKPLFGLKKTGTHWIVLNYKPKKVDASKPWNYPVASHGSNLYFVPGNQKYLIYRYGSDTAKVLEPEFDEELQKYILFQEAVFNEEIGLDNFWLSPEGFIQSHELGFNEYDVNIRSNLQSIYTPNIKERTRKELIKELSFNIRRDLEAKLGGKFLHMINLIFEVLKI